jgi:two-component sensor histidine kinase
MTAPVEREFTGDASAPTLARAFVLAVVDPLLGSAPSAEASTARDDIQLVVSELVTNAVRAGSSVVRVGVTHEAGRVRIGVEDEGSGWPEQRAAGIHDPNGRGLALVSALCASWGVRLDDAGGKTVWAEVVVPPTG